MYQLIENKSFFYNPSSMQQKRTDEGYFAKQETGNTACKIKSKFCLIWITNRYPYTLIECLFYNLCKSM